MTESPEDYELFHYGVKGMKWGVRRKKVVSVASNMASRTRDTIDSARGKTKREVAGSVVKGSGRLAKKGALRTLKSYTPTNQQDAKIRAQKILDRNGGNKAKAITKTVASTIGKQFVLGVAATKMMLAVPVSSVPVGIGTSVAGLSVAAKGVQDVYNISRANR